MSSPLEEQVAQLIQRERKLSLTAGGDAPREGGEVWNCRFKLMALVTHGGLLQTYSESATSVHGGSTSVVVVASREHFN